MSGTTHELRARAKAQSRQLIEAISAAEAVIVTTVERECEALRAGQMLAANALHIRLRDAARLYLSAAKAVRSSLWTVERVLPGSRDFLDEQRAAFAAVLKVEFAVLAAERRDCGERADLPGFVGGEPHGDSDESEPHAPSRRVTPVTRGPSSAAASGAPQRSARRLTR